MKVSTKCGFCGFYPQWLQYFATTRAFIVIYGMLGTIQAMSFVFIGVSLTTLEKRFKIPSKTTGILLSGNEISQILSVILIYYGGAGHRPRWIAIGVGFSALSCFVLALPHFLYGPGEEALALTHEYFNSTILSTGVVKQKDLPICTELSRPDSCTNHDGPTESTILPRFLVFFSQFILGIGTTLYYGLGQTYMDDNTKKKNTALILGITFSLRMVGPALGFVLSYFCLRLYIDPTLHPIIEDKDPRWVGAWWLGWIILGTLMALSSLLLALFPHELRKHESKKKKVPLSESEVPLKSEELNQKPPAPEVEKPTMKEFVLACKRIMKNKLIMYNTFSGIFYILGAAPFMYFIAKYLEVQYGTSSGGGTIIAGPLKILGVVMGFLISGIVINKYKPSARALMAWNVLIGIFGVVARIVFIYIKCDTGVIQGVNLETMELNLTAPCNVDCMCDQVKFSPVCHEPSGITYFSACHAGCKKVINDTAFANCNCVSKLAYQDTTLESASFQIESQFAKSFQEYESVVTVGPCKQDCFSPYIIFSFLSASNWILGCSGRIGTVLLTYRCVETRDKSLAQGVAMMLLSLLSLIPAPILAGALMDSTCLIWDVSCKDKGNCWVYHKDKFNWIINIFGAGLNFLGLLFDALCWYYATGLDLYGEEEEEAEKRRIAQLKNNDAVNDEVSNANP